MKNALKVIVGLVAVGGIGFLSYKLFFAKKGTPPTVGGDKKDKKDSIKSTEAIKKSPANTSAVIDTVAPIKTFHPGDMVYISTALTDAAPLFIYSRATTSDTKVGSSRPSWWGTQPIGAFKAFSADKKMILVTFKDFQIWKENGTTVGKITGDYFVPIEDVATSPY